MSEDKDLINRGRGILTRNQRKHLLGQSDEDVDQTTIRQRKYRIRKHLREALVDFQILAEAYHKVDVDTAIDPGYNDPLQTTDSDKTPGEAIEEEYDDPELADGIASVFEVFYRALGEIDPSESSAFRHFLWRGATLGLEQKCIEEGWSILLPPFPQAMTFDIAVFNSYQISVLKSAYEDSEFLFLWELKHLYWAGEISYEELQNARKRMEEKKSQANEEPLKTKRIQEREKWGLSGPPPSSKGFSGAEEEKRDVRDMFSFDNDEESDEE